MLPKRRRLSAMISLSEQPIAVFDSGVGGISVLAEATRLLPNEDFIFYGDNANAPYGSKSADEIVGLCRRVTEHLLSQNVKAILIACNTATSAYAAKLRAEIALPVIGMEPAIKPASLVRKNGVVLALATKATLTLDKFERLMQRYGEGGIPLEGKGFVEMVEQGRADSRDAFELVQKELTPYLNRPVDGIVLGCTHYPFLRKHFEALFPGVPIFDGREGTARQLKRRLQQSGLLRQGAAPGSVRFETSGNEENLRLMNRLYLSLKETP